MARRQIRSPRFPLANAGNVYEAVPCFRHVVAPGESLRSLRFMAKLQSLPLKAALAGAYVDVWFFYVPMRAVWPEWPQFIMGGPGTVPSIPASVGTNNQSRYFEHGFGKHTLFMRAYASIINRFFRTQVDTPFVHSAVSNQHVLASLPNPDIGVEGMFTPQAYDLDRDVTVTANKFTVRDLWDQEALLKHDQRMEDSTGHYADYLRMFGVNAKPNMIIEPEPLGHYRKFIMPSRVPSEVNGSTQQSYFHEMEMKLTKPRFFPEHGYIVGIMSVRPKIYRTGHGAFEHMWDKPSEWPLAGKPDLLDQQYGSWGAVTHAAGTEYTSDAFLQYGQQLIGAAVYPASFGEASGYTIGGTAVTPEQWRFPVKNEFLNWFNMVPENNGNIQLGPIGGSYIGLEAVYAFDGVCSLQIATPLRLKVPDHQTVIGNPGEEGTDDSFVASHGLLSDSLSAVE